MDEVRCRSIDDEELTHQTEGVCPHCEVISLCTVTTPNIKAFIDEDNFPVEPEIEDKEE